MWPITQVKCSDPSQSSSVQGPWGSGSCVGKRSLSTYELEHGSVNLIHSKPTGEDFLLYQALATANQLTGKKTND